MTKVALALLHKYQFYKITMKKNRQPKPNKTSAELLDEAYMRGISDADKSLSNSVSRSYNGITEGYFSAESIISKSMPHLMKDRANFDRHDEIKKARSLTDSNVWMARYLQSASARIYGKSGPQLISKLSYRSYKDGKPTDIVHEVASDVINRLWKDFTLAYNLDVAKYRTWNDFIGEDVATGLPRDGTILWLVHCFDPSKPGALNKYGVSLQQFDVLRVQSTINMPPDKNGTKVIAGVELNKFGSRTAVYLDLNSSTMTMVGGEALLKYKRSINNTNYLRVPMLDELNYQYEGIYAMFYDCDPSPLPEQVWGRPWAAVAFTSMHADAKLDYALQVAALAGASKSVVIRKDANGNSPAMNTFRNSAGVTNVQLVPGQVNTLEPGQQIDTIDFDLPYEGTLKFSQKIMRGVAAALAIPYPELTSDYDRSSYSVENSAEARNNRLWHQRRNHIVSNLLAPLVRFWFRKVVHLGLVTYYADGEVKEINKPMLYDMATQLTFQFDNIERPTTLDDEKAMQIRLQTGVTTVAQEIRARGGNPDDVFKNREVEIAQLNSSGIIIEGVNFNVEDEKNKVKKYEIDTLADVEKLKIDATNASRDVQQGIARSLDSIASEVEVTKNIQQTILRNVGGLEVDINSSKNNELLSAVIASQTTQKVEKDDSNAIIRKYSVAERDDGTFDLNTLTVLEQKIELVPEKKEVLTKPVEVVDTKIDPLASIQQELDQLIEDVKNLDI